MTLYINPNTVIIVISCIALYASIGHVFVRWYSKRTEIELDWPDWLISGLWWYGLILMRREYRDLMHHEGRDDL